jgi:aminopeptidase N
MKLFFTSISIFLSVFTQAQSVTAVLQEMKCQALQERQMAGNLLNEQNNSRLLSGASDNYDVKHYQCEWEIDPAILYIKGKITTTFITTNAINSIIFDLSKVLLVDSVVYKGVKIGFVQNVNHTLTINFPSVVNANSTEKISVFYRGVPDSGGFGSFTKSTHAGVPVLWTLSEPYGARDWWPCKDVLTDKADSVDIIVTCPAAYRTSSNGMLISEVVNTGKRTMQYKHRFPITSYLVAIACTNYVVASTAVSINGLTMPFENWTYPESAGSFAAEAYGIENALNWFSGFYGPYPFATERYAQTQFSWGGGQEHQTNSFIVSPNHLLQAHELAHQWFGDKTTCGSWRDIWVNEGFASFSHWLYFQNHDMPTYLGIRQEFVDEVTSDSTGSVYVPDTTSVSRIFSWRWSYVKGAYLLHMLRGMLGDAVFFQAMKNYSNDAATKFGYAKTGDVQRVFEQTSGKNLSEFFKDWAYGQGWPIYNVQWYNNTNGYLNVKINQRQSHPSVSFFEMPLRLRFKNATRDSTIVLDVQQNGQLFAAKLDFIPDTVLVDPDLWLLSKNNSTQKMTLATGTNMVSVNPNPATNSNWAITIKNPSFNVYNVQLVNSLGQTIYRNTLTTTGGDIRSVVNSAYLASGTYHLVVYADNKVLHTQKLIR